MGRRSFSGTLEMRMRCPFGGENLDGKRFCGDCGTPVGAATVPATWPLFDLGVAAQPSRQPAVPSTELRHVSALLPISVDWNEFAGSFHSPRVA